MRQRRFFLMLYPAMGWISLSSPAYAENAYFSQAINSNFGELCATANRSSEQIRDSVSTDGDFVAKQIVMASASGNTLEAGYWKVAKSEDGVANQGQVNALYFATTIRITGVSTYRSRYAAAGTATTGRNEICIRRVGNPASTGITPWNVFINGNAAYPSTQTLNAGVDRFQQSQFNIETNNGGATFTDGTAWENLRFKSPETSPYTNISTLNVFNFDRKQINPTTSVTWRSVYESANNRTVHYTR